jgi:putative NADH-flavin reductase
MRIAVVGATGRTGRRVVEQALTRGYDVTALARRPDSIAIDHPKLTRIAADVLQSGTWVRALVEVDRVVSALGAGTSRRPTTIYSTGTTTVLKAMTAKPAARLAVISAAPVANREEQPFLERRLLMPVLDRIFAATYEDMRRMETLLNDSEVDWVSLRPPRLIDKPATGRYRMDATRPIPNSRSITTGDLATALLDSLDSTSLHRRTAYVAN